MLKIPLPTINTARNLSLTVIVITLLLPRPPRTPRLRTTRPTRFPWNPHLKLTNTKATVSPAADISMSLLNRQADRYQNKCR